MDRQIDNMCEKNRYTLERKYVHIFSYDDVECYGFVVVQIESVATLFRCEIVSDVKLALIIAHLLFTIHTHTHIHTPMS